ncbi:MAG: ABC transporter permease [Acidimicrobiia bacterium]
MSVMGSTRRLRPLVAVAAVGLGLLALPFVGLVARAPWSTMVDLLSAEVALDALRLSVTSSLAATVLAAALGLPIAWLLARVPFPGRSAARAVVTLPLILPPVVGGAALLFAVGRRGILGEPLYQASGIVLPFSWWGVVVANVFVAMPFLVISVEGALRSMNRRVESAAATLGASPAQILWRVTLPTIRPAVVAGLALTWARAFGEFGATVTFAGNLAGRTQTLPLAVFVALESNRELAVALSLLMVAVSLAVLVALRNWWWGFR